MTSPARPAPQERGRSDLAVLTRWETSGGTWRVASRTATSVTIELMTCSADEVMGRLHTSEPAVMAYVASRRLGE